MSLFPPRQMLLYYGLGAVRAICTMVSCSAVCSVATCSSCMRSMHASLAVTAAALVSSAAAAATAAVGSMQL
jgi:hypothetical protein